MLIFLLLTYFKTINGNLFKDTLFELILLLYQIKKAFELTEVLCKVRAKCGSLSVKVVCKKCKELIMIFLMIFISSPSCFRQIKLYYFSVCSASFFSYEL